MDFVDAYRPEPISGFLSVLPLIAGVAVGVTLLVTIVPACLRSGFPGLSFALFTVSFVTFVASGIPVMVHNMPKYGEQQDSARKLVERTYNLDLDYEQFSDLDYPYGKPTAKFKVFGKTHTRLQTVGSGFREADIYLVWADGKFGLSESSDGKEFKQLTAKS